MVAADGIDIDLSWRPAHPELHAFGAYLDFGLLHDAEGDVGLVSVHATSWRPESWEATGSGEAMPRGLVRPWPSDGILNALIEVLEGRHAVLAGDWNEDLDYPGPGDPDAASFRQRASHAGLVEVVSTTFKGKVRTNFSHQTKTAYQNDQVFVTADLAARVRSVAVWSEPAARLSDHAGIAVTFGPIASTSPADT